MVFQAQLASAASSEAIDHSHTSGHVFSSSTAESAGKPKRNKPLDTKLRQQKLPAWQPILTASTVIPTVFAIGIIFLPIGIALFFASRGVQEKIIDYTHCETPSSKPCVIDIDINTNYKGDVYFYYALDNYYQNHRRYMKSRSDSQLLGNLQNVGDCEPFAHINTSEGSKVIAPCGAVANSMFNDTFSLYRYGIQDPVPWTYKGVVWPSDKERRYKNPSGSNLKNAFANTEKPPNWKKYVWELDLQDPDNNGFLNTDFIVWMRTAALPNFRKLHRILVRNGNFSQQLYANGLPSGKYVLKVQSNYPVVVFGGRKYFIISTTSWAGGKNAFLGISYVVVGSVCLVLGAVFLLIHIKFGNA